MEKLPSIDAPTASMNEVEAPPPEPKRKSLRYIQRDSQYDLWKVSIRRKGEHIWKYFADNAHGGKEDALRAAISYRNELVFKMTDTDYRMWRRNLVPPTNTTGIVGVCRYTQRKAKDNSEYVVWQGYWKNADGKRCSKSFHVNQHGEEKAKELASQARLTGLEQVRAELELRSKKPKCPLSPPKLGLIRKSVDSLSESTFMELLDELESRLQLNEVLTILKTEPKPVQNAVQEIGNAISQYYKSIDNETA